jgi:low temperature requirement protein LtrA
MFTGFRRRFWQPPRAHGEIIDDRRVSFLELFYDLVYVVVIARTAATLAADLTWRTAGEFAVIFGMIWVGWVNGAIYHELHSREDGRTRVFVFLQMLILTLLAVFASGAGGDDGPAFAITYAVFLAVLAWLWASVRRHDDEIFRVDSGRYVIGMLLSIVAMVFSAFVPEAARMTIWAVFVLGWIVGAALLARTDSFQVAAPVTPSMVERYGLLIIIVLGEVVVGVVDGIAHSPGDARSIATGLIALTVGFAYWWTYFDFVGEKMPIPSGPALARWMYSHLPLIMAIAGAGAAMVSLIEHAGDDRAPVATSWLLTGAVAVGLLSLVLTMSALQTYRDHPGMHRSIASAVTVTAAASIAVGWWRPAPWVLVLVLLLLLTAVWFNAVSLKLQQQQGIIE